MMLTITHDAVAGTLIEGTARGDGTTVVLKARGWRWGRSIGCWYVPMSRDREPKTAIIEATAAGLREVGHTVEVVVSEQLRSPAEVEADKVARQDDREAALAERADRKHAAATVAEQWARELADMVPFGQPEKKIGRGSRRDIRGFDKWTLWVPATGRRLSYDATPTPKTGCPMLCSAGPATIPSRLPTPR